MNRQPQSVPQEILINTKVVTSQWRSLVQATQSKSSKITPMQETNPMPPTRQDAKKKKKDRDLRQRDACAEAAGPIRGTSPAPRNCPCLTGRPVLCGAPLEPACQGLLTLTEKAAHLGPKALA